MPKKNSIMKTIRQTNIIFSSHTSMHEVTFQAELNEGESVIKRKKEYKVIWGCLVFPRVIFSRLVWCFQPAHHVRTQSDKHACTRVHVQSHTHTHTGSMLNCSHYRKKTSKPIPSMLCFQFGYSIGGREAEISAFWRLFSTGLLYTLLGLLN